MLDVIAARDPRPVTSTQLATELKLTPGTISVPTLLVWGDRDDFVPRSDQDALPARIPDAELKVYAGGGHAAHWEEPERFAADLAEFAAGLT